MFPGTGGVTVVDYEGGVMEKGECVLKGRGV